MSKVAVVYWSGTGNTEAMAEAVLEGVKEAGGEGVMMMCTDFDVSMMDSFDAIAFGCPSMGDEVLEESEFAPVFEGCETKLSGKKTALFGRWPVDERLGKDVQRRRRSLGLRRRHMQ